MAKSIILILIATLLCFNVNAQVTVGWEDTCDYDISENPIALQQAIDEGNLEIRLTNEDEYLHSISIRNQVQIKGGYVNCQEAVNGNQTNVNSIINAALDDFYSGVFIFDIEDADILLNSLTIKNGTDSGVYITKMSGNVTLNNVDVIENTGANGAGINIDNNHMLAISSMLIVNIENSVIKDNQAEGPGGGIHCGYSQGNVPIKMNINQGTIIQENHSNQRGGGISLFDCDLRFEAGIHSANNGSLEIAYNTSDSSGGGISLQDSVVDLIGDYTQSFDLRGNENGVSGQNNATGGALFAVGFSEVNLINTSIISNISKGSGAGIFTTVGTSVTMDVAANGCDYDDYCSFITSNHKLSNSGGGAVAAASGGSIEINRTAIRFNKTNGFGYLTYASNDASITLEGNLILQNSALDGFTADNGFYQKDSSSLSLYYNTTSQNLLMAPLIRADDNSELNMIGNVINQFSDNLHSGEFVTTNINCNMFTQTDNMTVSMNNTIIDHLDFVDSSTFGDYRLRVTDTSAIDVCSSSFYQPGLDLSNSQRGIDNPDVPNVNGLFDLGAYEFVPVIDHIFSNSFE